MEQMNFTRSMPLLTPTTVLRNVVEKQALDGKNATSKKPTKNSLPRAKILTGYTPLPTPNHSCQTYSSLGVLTSPNVPRRSGHKKLTPNHSCQTYSSLEALNSPTVIKRRVHKKLTPNHSCQTYSSLEALTSPTVIKRSVHKKLTPNHSCQTYSSLGALNSPTVIKRRVHKKTYPHPQLSDIQQS